MVSLRAVEGCSSRAEILQRRLRDIKIRDLDVTVEQFSMIMTVMRVGFDLSAEEAEVEIKQIEALLKERKL